MAESGRRQDPVRDCLELMLYLEAARRPVPFEELRTELDAYRHERKESARRKFERDKDRLRSLGVTLEVVKTEGGVGYRLDDARTFLFDVELEPEERALLEAVCGGLAADPHFPRRDALVQALAKLNVTGEAGETPAEAAVRAPIAVLHPVRGDEEVAQLGRRLADAVQARRQVRLRYRSARGRDSERLVDPYALFLSRGQLYLCGHCHASDSLRVFRVDRITALEVPRSQRTTPDFDVPEDFDLAAVADLDPPSFPLHAPLEVTVRASEAVAHLVRRHLRGAVEDPPGTFVVTTSNLDAVVQLVLYLGEHAEILGPGLAREAMREALDALLEAHDG